MENIRKIKLEEWLQFTRDYFSDLRGKDIFNGEIRKEVNKRITELSNLEQMLFRTGQLEPPPDDFNEGFDKLITANRRLGWRVPTGKQLERTRQRVKRFCEGKGVFVISTGSS